MYTVYRITNKLNDKHYIGVHKTDDPNDSYMGSGVAIRNAIKKHGKDNFYKEVLLITENKQEAYDLEASLTEDFTSNKNYNMKRGGVGGWSPDAAAKGGKTCSLEDKSKAGYRSYELGVGIHSQTSEQKKEAGKRGGLANKGKPKTAEQKAKIAASLKGQKYKPRQPSLW